MSEYFKSSTIVNGEELKQYDNFREYINKIKKEIENQNDYTIMPDILNYDDKIMELFSNGSDTDKRYMFGLLYNLFLYALKHWKIDLDYLYTEKGKEKFAKIYDVYKEIIPYFGSNPIFDMADV